MTSDPNDQGSLKDKFNETLDSLRKNEKIDGLYSYAKNNTIDMIAYVFLIIGLVLLFWQSFYGGLLIGLIGGFYFSTEIVAACQTGNEFVEKQGMVRSLILGGTLLAFFISAPAIFIGAAVIVGLKYLLTSNRG